MTGRMGGKLTTVPAPPSGAGGRVHRIATPHGNSPTAISLTTALAAVSITDTLLERPLATYSFLPSGVTAMFHGRLPTGMVAITSLLAVSITDTLPSLPLEM